MKSSTRFTTTLRSVAIATVIAGIATWLATGARVGWTQTSTVRFLQDEITGIEYPVRENGFVAGVEVPLLATATAAVLAGLSFLPRRRATANA
jgi:hypothetical protein